MKRQKRQQRRTVTMLSLILGCLAIVGVVFASWVIINPEVNAQASGTITVDEVVDSSISIEKAWADSKDTVRYGANGTKKTGDWLINNEESAVECLTLTLNVTISNASYLDGITCSAVTSTGGGTIGEKTGYAGAFADGLVGALPTPVVGDVSTPDSDDKATCTITITFTWGTAFGTENPYDYYNDLDYATYHEEAHTNLTNLKTYLTGATFAFTLTATSKVQ